MRKGKTKKHYKNKISVMVYVMLNKGSRGQNSRVFLDSVLGDRSSASFSFLVPGASNTLMGDTVHGKQEVNIQLPAQNSLERAGKFQLQVLLSFEELKKKDQSQLAPSCNLYGEQRRTEGSTQPPRENTHWYLRLTGTVDE